MKRKFAKWQKELENLSNIGKSQPPATAYSLLLMVIATNSPGCLDNIRHQSP